MTVDNADRPDPSDPADSGDHSGPARTAGPTGPTGSARPADETGTVGPAGPTGSADPTRPTRPTRAAHPAPGAPRRPPANLADPAHPAGPPDGAPVTRVLRRTCFTLTTDGSYAACLAEAAVGAGAEATTAWFAERWTLDGPEPYTVPLPGTQPEEPGTQVLPLPDGRVLIRRRVAERHDLALLYPSGAGTGELPLGSLTGTEVRLLPPVAAGVFALTYDGAASDVWQVQGTGQAAPLHVIRVAGRCTGGVWLDRAGGLLALDRTWEGRTKAVAVDLRAGAVSPLLQLTDDSDDRLVLAEPDSGLLVLRSDATGEARLGWGVLGSRLPVRFPDVLRERGVLFTPVAAQPGQILAPDASVVAFRCATPGGGESLALWRPGEGVLHWRVPPPNWLGSAALWLPNAPLRLPYAPTGLACYDPPPPRDLPTRRPARSCAAARPARPAPSVLPLQQAPLTPVA